MSGTNITDLACMQRALQLAARGRGRVEPNPMVGCVLARGERIIGTGYHRRFGGPHAEVLALRDCREDPAGATVYINLEPCCYHGKTPPCTEALIAARVKRVVAAMTDPNPRVAGRGLRLLRRAGISTEVGLLRVAAMELNAPFLKLIRRRRPWIILKWAQSLDGKIATRTGDAEWITDEVMRAHVHRERGRLDALLIGIGTVRTDDPLLTCRVGRPRRVAARMVLDPHLKIPTKAHLVQTAGRVPTWIFCRRDARGAGRLEKAGCKIVRVPATAAGVSLPAVLDVLGKQQMTNLLVEGGGRVLGAFFDQQLADEVHIYIAPRLIGGATASGPLHGRGIARVADSVVLPADAALKRLGQGWLMQARI
ncbi:MAG: bifunctional diaminohydroxyphosphoribosylaminopyrimidine deaminase/5-amino-6-(5-phosphoribosylamino)uracil reductase RibD [Planctomycetota bacterium]